MTEIDHHTSPERAVKAVEGQIGDLENVADRVQAEAWVRGARDILTGGGGYGLVLASGRGILEIPEFSPVLGRADVTHPTLRESNSREEGVS